MQASTLNQLYPRGTRLADVPPDFEGMVRRTWQYLQLSAQCERYYESRATAKPEKWTERAIWKPRDSYGMKGI